MKLFNDTNDAESEAKFYKKLYEAECQKTQQFERLIGRFVTWFCSLVDKAKNDNGAANDQLKSEFDAISKAFRDKAN